MWKHPHGHTYHTADGTCGELGHDTHRARLDETGGSRHTRRHPGAVQHYDEHESTEANAPSDHAAHHSNTGLPEETLGMGVRMPKRRSYNATTPSLVSASRSTSSPLQFFI